MPQGKSHTPAPDRAGGVAASAELSDPADQISGRARQLPDRVHLLLCSNSLFIQHTAVCLVSLLANNLDLFFDIAIVGRASEKLDEDKLQRSLAHFPNHSVTFRKFTPPAECHLPLNPRAHYTLDNWTRLWVEEFFAEKVDRVLYLDSDIVVIGSIAALWHTDLNGALFGAVDIPGSLHGVEKLAMRVEDGYFNSGVLLIDLEQWRRTRALKTILDYIGAHPERLVYTLDQDALNACFSARRKRLDYKWNATWSFFRESAALPLSAEELERVRRETPVVHFNGSLKPWSYFCDHPRRGEYQKYLRMTEWRDFVPADRTPLNMLHKRISELLPQHVKRLLHQTCLGALKRRWPGA